MRASIATLILLLSTLLIICVPFSARAQQESASAGLGAEPTTSASAHTVEVKGDRAVSPAWTQSRSFAATRFWRLDQGEQEVELWYSARLSKDGDTSVDQHLFQLEYMFSPIRGLQVDVYFNYLWDVTAGTRIEGAQIEARIAPWDYGTVFGNPVLYLEWHPQNHDANRGEVRLLFGGKLLPGLRAAMNLLWEQNLDSPDGIAAHYTTDREIGGTAALAYEIVPQHFALGAETRLIFDQQGGSTYQTTYKVGPSIWWSFADNHLRLTSTFLFGTNPHTDHYNPLVILGYHP